MANDEVKCIFIGKEFISVGFSREKDNEITFKDIGSLPFKGYYPLMIKPIHFDSLWEERTEFRSSGKQKDKIRIVWMDRFGDSYSKNINPVEKAKLSTLETENQTLKSVNEKLLRMISAASDLDKLQNYVKNQYKFYTEELRSAPTFFGGNRPNE